MRWATTHNVSRAVLVSLTIALGLGCEREYIPVFLGGDAGRQASRTSGGVFRSPTAASAFSGFLIQGRTFTNGASVTTVTYLLDDLGNQDNVAAADVLYRTPLGIDFNADGKIDPVVGYGGNQAVIQILLSDPSSPAGEVDYISLTLDSKRDMQNLSDVAAGDIDRDGALDVVAAAGGAVWYYHHPTGAPTTAMYLWGNPDPTDELRERIDASYHSFTDAELQALISQAIGPGVNLDDYVVTIEQRYTNVEIGDMDNDGDNDIVASRSFVLTLTPRPDVPVEPLQISDGDVLVFANPGFAADGHNWSAISIGGHERQTRLDRDGASELLLYDLDADGDLDVISAASKDNNVQVAWFENPVANRVGAPGAGLSLDQRWTQWRIGSIRSAWGLDVGDLTGDGRADVVATGKEQMQMLLFEQPETGPKRAYDWDTYVLYTFESFQPLDVKILDVDMDGDLEIVTGGTSGAVRYYEATADPREAWEMITVYNYASADDVGWLGFGDLDGDGDLDLVPVISSSKENSCRVTWIRNETITLQTSTGN